MQAEHPIDTAAETNTPPGEGRYNSYDLLRIFSAISVIIIHVNAHFFGSRAGAPSSSLYYVAESLLNIVTRFSVPAFIMISGAFILGNPANRDYIYFYKKSSYKIFLPTFAVHLQTHSIADQNGHVTSVEVTGMVMDEMEQIRQQNSLFD